MRKKPVKTWIVVADSASAQFYALHESGAECSIEPVAETMVSGIHRHAADLKSDKPGRAFAGAGSAMRSALEPHHDYHKLEKHDFIRAIAMFLEHAFAEHKFERLILAAPDRSLGELRRELPDKVRAAVRYEIPKDLTKLERRDLRAHLEQTFKEAALR